MNFMRAYARIQYMGFDCPVPHDDRTGTPVSVGRWRAIVRYFQTKLCEGADRLARDHTYPED